MKIKGFLTGLVLATILAWACLIAVLNYNSPQGNGFGLLILFYLSLFAAIAGIFSIIGIFIRRISQGKKSVQKQIKISFRQGLLLSLVLVVALFLQSQQLFHWWSLIILLLVVGFIEWLLSEK